MHFGNIWAAKVCRVVRVCEQLKFVDVSHDHLVDQGSAFTFHDFRQLSANLNAFSLFSHFRESEVLTTFTDFRPFPKVWFRVFIANFRFKRLKIPFNTDEDHHTITDSLLSKMIGGRWETNSLTRIGRSPEMEIGQFSQRFPGENPRKMFSFTLKFFTTTGRYFSVGSLTNTRSKIISIFATITNIVKVSALLIKMFFHLVKIQYGGARERHAQREGIASPKEERSSQTVNRMRRIRAELVTRPRADHKSLWMKEREKVKLGKYHQQLLFRSRWDHSNSSQEFRELTVTTRRRNVSIESTQREFYFLMTKVRRQIRA